MDLISLFLLSLGLSLDDFALAFALSLMIPIRTSKDRVVQTAKMALAFSFSTAVLPLLGWLIGLAIFSLVASIGAWIVLIVFCGVGVWIIKEAFENEVERDAKLKEKNISSFWMLLLMGILGSFDEGAIGIGFPFLDIDVVIIIIAVIIVNTILIILAMVISAWKSKLNQKIPPIISGIILIILGIINWVELVI